MVPRRGRALILSIGRRLRLRARVGCRAGPGVCRAIPPPLGAHSLSSVRSPMPLRGWGIREAFPAVRPCKCGNGT